MIWVAVAVPTAVAFGFAVAIWWDSRFWFTRKTGRRVTVHTVTERSIEGVLRIVARDGVVLAAGTYLDAERPVEMAGDTFIPRDQVLFVQVGER